MMIGRREKVWEIFYQIKDYIKIIPKSQYNKGKKWFKLSSTFKILLAKKTLHTECISI